MDDRTLSAVRLIIRDRDGAIRNSAEFPELPRIEARYRGQAEAYDLALAYLAGAHGCGTRQELEAAVAELAPR